MRWNRRYARPDSTCPGNPTYQALGRFSSVSDQGPVFKTLGQCNFAYSVLDASGRRCRDRRHSKGSTSKFTLIPVQKTGPSEAPRLRRRNGRAGNRARPALLYSAALFLIDMSLNIPGRNRHERKCQDHVARIGRLENHEARLVIRPRFAVVNQRELNGVT